MRKPLTLIMGGLCIALGISASSKNAALENETSSSIVKIIKADPKKRYSCKLYKEDFVEYREGLEIKYALVLDYDLSLGKKTGYRRAILRLFDGKVRLDVLSDKYLERISTLHPEKLIFRCEGAKEVAYEKGKLSRSCGEVFEECRLAQLVQLKRQRQLKKQRLRANLADDKIKAKPIKKPRRRLYEEYGVGNSGYLLDMIVEDECQIREVQQSSVTFGFQDNFAMHHNFVFISCENPEKTLTLVYPYPKMIKKGIVNVKYKPTMGGSISSKDFLEKFVILYEFREKVLTNVLLGNNVSPRLYVDLFPIEADGIIIKDGINYK